MWQLFLVLDLLHVRNKLSRTNTRLAPKPPKNQHHLNSIWRICTRLKFHLDSDTFAPLYLGPACALPSANVGQWPPPGPGTAESLAPGRTAARGNKWQQCQSWVQHILARPWTGDRGQPRAGLMSLTPSWSRRRVARCEGRVHSMGKSGTEWSQVMGKSGPEWSQVI